MGFFDNASLEKEVILSQQYRSLNISYWCYQNLLSSSNQSSIIQKQALAPTLTSGSFLRLSIPLNLFKIYIYLSHIPMQPQPYPGLPTQPNYNPGINEQRLGQVNDMQFQENGLTEAQRKFREEQRRQLQIKYNIQRVKTPIEKLQAIPLCKLDVGVCDSLADEFSAMCVKISYVLIPRSDANSYRLRNWDMWGPFFMLLIFAFFVDHSSQLLMLIFSTIIGAYIVSFNVIALGGRISFFQSVSILNYCIFPILFSVFFQRVLLFFQVRNRVITLTLTGVATVWSILSVRVFIGVNVAENRKLIAIYPAVLFYIFIGLMLAFN